MNKIIKYFKLKALGFFIWGGAWGHGGFEPRGNFLFKISDSVVCSSSFLKGYILLIWRTGLEN